jgi:hypothetical protein
MLLSEFNSFARDVIQEGGFVHFFWYSTFLAHSKVMLFRTIDSFHSFDILQRLIHSLSLLIKGDGSFDVNVSQGAWFTLPFCYSRCLIHSRGLLLNVM